MPHIQQTTPCRRNDYPQAHSHEAETSTRVKVDLTQGCATLNLELHLLQGQMPCVTEDGRLIMAKADRLSWAPDGNGGVYLALHRCAPKAFRVDSALPNCALTQQHVTKRMPSLGLLRTAAALHRSAVQGSNSLRGLPRSIGL